MKPLSIVEQLEGAVKVVVRGPRFEKVSSDSVETVGMMCSFFLLINSKVFVEKLT